MKPFGYAGENGSCLWCGEELKHSFDTKWEDTDKVRPAYPECVNCGNTEFELVRDPETISPFDCTKCGMDMSRRKVKKVASREQRTVRGGYMDNGHFCSLRCGFQFGLWHAKNGSRLRMEKKGASNG